MTGGLRRTHRRVYRAPAELLERDGALAVLAAARDDAARGEGRVVVVTGEAGIGKTSLVTRFLEDVGPRARVLLGTCDDLSIPRPLGPLHDLAGSVSEPLDAALAGGAAPYKIHRLLIEELEREGRLHSLALTYRVKTRRPAGS